MLEGKLNTLLERQQAAIDAMNAANSQLAAIKQLSERQADAIAALDAAANDRLNAISVATQQGVINLFQVCGSCCWYGIHTCYSVVVGGCCWYGILAVSCFFVGCCNQRASTPALSASNHVAVAANTLL